jgi:hypothetical protein
MINSFINHAQEITIPTDNSASATIINSLKRKPLGSYYDYERSAFIFTKEELNQSSAISLQGISFFCDTINSLIAATTPVKIYLKASNDSLFTSPTLYSNEILNASLVFSGNLLSSQFSENNWVTIAFNSSFVLPINTNLKLFIETNSGGAGNESSLSKGFRFKTTGVKKFQYWQQDQTEPSGAGTLDTLRPNIKLNYSVASNCNGIPNSGTIQLNDTAVCKGALTSCYISGQSNSSGITYQWQQSIDQQSWIAVNQNGNAIQLPIDTLTYLRAIVFCNGIDSSITPVVQIKNLLPVYCYCSNNLGGNCNGYSIDSLSIQNTSFAMALSGCENNAGSHYSYYSPIGAATATLTAGQTYSVTIRQTGNNYSSLWIDYNHNGVFEADEWTRLSINSVTNGLQTFSLSIPATAYNGLTGMRVRSRNSSFPITNTQSCTNFSTGETEDFMVSITGGLNIGINESTLKNQGFVFPNPTSEEFYYQNTSIKGELDVLIIDALGKNVYNQKSIHQNVSLINAQLNKGLYFILIKQNSVLLQTVKLLVN